MSIGSLLRRVKSSGRMTPTSNLSTATVLAPGASTPRSLADHVGTLPDSLVLGRALATRFGDEINARDAPYSAKGDGVTDDTAALQAAINAVIARRGSYTPSGGIVTRWLPELVLRSGHYVISDALTASGNMRIRALGRVVIRQTNPAAGIFSSTSALDVSISGITFIGGAFGLHFENNNIDFTTYLVDDCEFQQTAGFAIEVVPTSPADHLSAQVVVSRSRFYDPRQVVKNYADHFVFDKNWVSWHYPEAVDDTAAFENHKGKLVITDMLGVPGFTYLTGPNARWIDNYGSVVIDRARFGGENSGLPIIWNYGAYKDVYPYAGSAIIIRDSQVSAGPNWTDLGKSGIVVLKTEVPGMVWLSGLTFPVDVPFIRNDGIADLAAYMAAAVNQTRAFTFRFEGALPQPLASGLVPTELLPYFVRSDLLGAAHRSVISADRGDADATLVFGADSEVQRWATTLTASRTVTLSTSGAILGAKFKVVRTGLGAFALDVGGLKTIPSATAAFVEVMHDGSAWVLTGYGTL